MLNWFTAIEATYGKALVVLVAVLCVACIDIVGRVKHKHTHYIFGCILGSLLALGFIALARSLFANGASVSGFTMALGIVLMVIAWHLVFGTWEANVKATVLGSLVFWIALHLIYKETPTERMAHMFAIAVAIVPAVVWCMLFLPYHREKISRVLLMFFAGMLSTAPILVYDALVRSKVELQFFYFTIVPQSFNSSTQSFVMGQLQQSHPVNSTLLVLFLSFICVGIIEEGSKFWVLRKSGRGIFSSVDDVIELAIIVAIGFAFAENVLNSGYFLAFVREYLILPDKKDWLGFFGNVAGRSVLTSMVHIVSTGIAGYFLGRAIFAEPLLKEQEARGRSPVLSEWISQVLEIDKLAIYRVQMISVGFVSAVVLHAFSNFMVTLPDALPGNPHTIAELLGLPASSPLQYVSLILFPCLLYVVGGFWLLTWLFERKENQAERGRLLSKDIFVPVDTLEAV